MKIKLNGSVSKKVIFTLVLLFTFILFSKNVEAVCDPTLYNTYPACATIDTQDLGFVIPSLGDLLTFVIRVFFVIAGLAALFYLLLGAFAWITSGGDEEGLKSAREKIQAAVVGMILIVAVLAIIWTLEQVIFKRRICLGLSCPLTLPGLIETNSGAENCCACLSDDGKYCGSATGLPGCSLSVIDTFSNQVCGP